MRSINNARALGSSADVFYPQIVERESPRDIQHRIVAMDDQRGLRMFAVRTEELAWDTPEHLELSRMIAIDEVPFFHRILSTR